MDVQNKGRIRKRNCAARVTRCDIAIVTKRHRCLVRSATSIAALWNFCVGIVQLSISALKTPFARQASRPFLREGHIRRPSHPSVHMLCPSRKEHLPSPEQPDIRGKDQGKFVL
ncbi:hypothetical protein K438DRAFT_2028025 [Mycena galopus ATCC 62051]|nr:hypothetical protein K438DRAFT_2028025 [Mycena galopus ATCC 62051]